MHLHHYNVITSCLYQLAVVSYHVLLRSYHYVIWYVYMVSRFWSQRFLLIFSCSIRPKMSQIFWSIGEWVTASRPCLARCAPWVSKPYAPWAAQSFSLLYEGPVKGETRNKSETNSSVQSSIRFSGKVWRCISHCNLFLHVPHCNKCHGGCHKSRAKSSFSESKDVKGVTRSDKTASRCPPADASGYSDAVAALPCQD